MAGKAKAEEEVKEDIKKDEPEVQPEAKAALTLPTEDAALEETHVARITEYRSTEEPQRAAEVVKVSQGTVKLRHTKHSRFTPLQVTAEDDKLMVRDTRFDFGWIGPVVDPLETTKARLTDIQAFANNIIPGLHTYDGGHVSEGDEARSDRGSLNLDSIPGSTLNSQDPEYKACGRVLAKDDGNLDLVYDGMLVGSPSIMVKPAGALVSNLLEPLYVRPYEYAIMATHAKHVSKSLRNLEFIRLLSKLESGGLDRVERPTDVTAELGRTVCYAEEHYLHGISNDLLSFPQGLMAVLMRQSGGGLLREASLDRGRTLSGDLALGPEPIFPHATASRQDTGFSAALRIVTSAAALEFSRSVVTFLGSGYSSKLKIKPLTSYVASELTLVCSLGAAALTTMVPRRALTEQSQVTWLVNILFPIIGVQAATQAFSHIENDYENRPDRDQTEKNMAFRKHIRANLRPLSADRNVSAIAPDRLASGLATMIWDWWRREPAQMSQAYVMQPGARTALAEARGMGRDVLRLYEQSFPRKCVPTSFGFLEQGNITSDDGGIYNDVTLVSTESSYLPYLNETLCQDEGKAMCSAVDLYAGWLACVSFATKATVTGIRAQLARGSLSRAITLVNRQILVLTRSPECYPPDPEFNDPLQECTEQFGEVEIDLSGALAFVKYGVTHQSDLLAGGGGGPDGALRGEYIEREVEPATFSQQAYLILEMAIFNTTWAVLGKHITSYPAEVYDVMERITRGIFEGSMVQSCRERFQYYRVQSANPISPLRQFLYPNQDIQMRNFMSVFEPYIKSLDLLPRTEAVTRDRPPFLDVGLDVWYGYHPDAQMMSTNGLLVSTNPHLASPASIRLNVQDRARFAQGACTTDPLIRGDDVVTWAARFDSTTALLSKPGFATIIRSGAEPANFVRFNPRTLKGDTLVLDVGGNLDDIALDSMALVMRMYRDKLGNDRKISLDVKNGPEFIARINAFIKYEITSQIGESPSQYELRVLMSGNDSLIKHVYFKSLVITLSDETTDVSGEGIGTSYGTSAAIEISEMSRGRGLVYKLAAPVKLLACNPTGHMESYIHSTVTPVLTSKEDPVQCDLLNVTKGCAPVPWRLRLVGDQVLDRVAGSYEPVPVLASKLMTRILPTKIHKFRRLPLTFTLESELCGSRFDPPLAPMDPRWSAGIMAVLSSIPASGGLAARAQAISAADEIEKPLVRMYVPTAEIVIKSFKRYPSFVLNSKAEATLAKM